MTPLDPAIAFEPGVCPDPPARPAGQLQWMRLLYKNPIAVFDRVAFSADFRQNRVPYGNFILVNEPRLIEHVLLTNHRNYSKGRLTRDALEPVLGDGLVTSEGDLWRRQRRIAAPGFHRQRLAQAAGAMSRLARQRVEGWRIPYEKGRPLDVDREMSSLTMEIVARTLFSMDMSESIDDIGRAMNTVIAAFGTVNPIDLFQLALPTWIPRPRSRRTRAALVRFEQAIQDIIAQRRRADEAPDDFLSLLVAARDQETGEGMSDKQLRDEVATFFAAGHETTAMALTWTLYLLSRHPAVERELAAEADRVLGDGEATFDDVESLSFTRMVIQERHHQLLRHPPQPAPVAGPAALRSGALRARADERTACLRLHPLQRRTARVHRQRLRHDGGLPGACHHRPRLPTARGARTPCRGAGMDHASGGAGFRDGGLPPRRGG